MSTLRNLRRDRQLTLSELALALGIPARMLAEIEHGLRPLEPELCPRLALALGLAPHRLQGLPEYYRLKQQTPLPPTTGSLLRQRAAAFAAASLVTAALLSTPRPTTILPTTPVVSQPATTPQPPVVPLTLPIQPAPTADAAAFLGQPTTLDSQHNNAPPVEAQQLVIQAPPRFQMLADGPHGCPIVSGLPLVITQGYGVGSHTPANLWGAIDLALDGDQDGYAEPWATQGASVVSTHDGIVRTYPDSWPGGNLVMVVDTMHGWTTVYAHLDQMLVVDNQVIQAGTQIGTIGSTGLSSGPHLHYEVRGSQGNVDPAPLIGCGQ